MNRSIVAMLLGTFVLRVSTAITGAMLVFYVDHLTHGSGTGQRDIAILHAGFYMTELVGAIAFGVLADRYGRKLIMLLGPAFGAIAVFLTGATSQLHVLFVTRLLEGSSTAASIPSTLGFIAAETSEDERLRGRVVSWFELVSLAGMLAVGPAVAGFLWEWLGAPAFFVNCGVYMVSLALYAYGVTEAPRGTAEAAAAHGEPGLRRYVRIATDRRVLLFAPTWLAINAVLGLWASQGLLLLRGNKVDPSQFLMQGVSPAAIGVGEAVFALFFGLGILFWGNVYARFRRTTIILYGVGAFGVLTIDVFVINHFGWSSGVLIAAGLVLVGALFVLSGATPAALGLLADVSEGFEHDRSAIMGMYSIFFGVGQVIGTVVGAIFASWRGIDGLVVATGLLTAVGLFPLLRLRSREHEMYGGSLLHDPGPRELVAALLRRRAAAVPRHSSVGGKLEEER